jgi:hypothetical protein
MIGGRLRLVALPALIVALAGCGQSSASRTPDLTMLPLVGGARIVAQVRQCDRGANAFCSYELVVVDPRYKSSTDLLEGEHRHLRDHGWAGAAPDTGEQRAAESPGNKLRVTYATAFGDLKGIDVGWIKRPWPITAALSRAMYNRASAISVMLETGSS